MMCPYCSNEETKVTDKRDTQEGTRRRREPFNRDKVFLGILKACEKREIGHDKIEEIVKELEEKIQSYKEIPTKKIGEFIMKKLKKLDKVAYIRFASVYKDFEDVKDFK